MAPHIHTNSLLYTIVPSIPFTNWLVNKLEKLIYGEWSGAIVLARALATGKATVILQAFQNNSFASEPTRE